MEERPKHLYEFGPFRLDETERLLLRADEPVPLTPKAFDLLLALVEQPGRLLSKETLLQAVWPDIFVEEKNLADNISRLRKALGEGENGQKFIETVPKSGYRFVAEVREVVAQAKATEVATPKTEAEVRPGPPSSQGPRHREGAMLALAALAIALGGTVFGLYKFIARSEGKSSGPEPKMIPVTSLLGSETHPAFSPDGRQIAFVWDGQQEDNYDIYVKLVNAGEPLQLTKNPAPDLNPVWSPDGRYIAFTREGEGSGVYLVPALGGAERKLAQIFPERPFSKLSLSYSPDGKYLAVADKSDQAEPYSLFLVSTETGEKRRLTFPPAGAGGDGSPAFSPDGKSIAFSRATATGVLDIHIVPLAGGELKRLTFDNAQTHGLSWTSDGGEIVFASRRGTGALHMWKVPVIGGAPARVAAYAQNLYHPATSRQENRLAWTQSLDDLNIWRVEINPATGQAGAPAKLIASSMGESTPQYSPDGQKIAFGSNRTGYGEIWVCGRNGENPIQLTTFGVFTSGTPRWSPDGREIVFDSLQEGNREIYIISADGGRPRRLTNDPAEDTCPSWSRDGRWIYFSSGRSGSLQIWKAPATGGQALQVTRQGGFEGFESPDGKYFYFAKRRVAGIWRVPVEGGEETLVLNHHRAGYWRYWAVTEQGIYFATAETPAHPRLEFFSFSTGKVTLVSTIEKHIQANTWGLAVSPDGRSILYSQLDQQGSDIMLMENFR